MSTTERHHAAATTRGLEAQPGQADIDPRGPRFGAGITAVLLLLSIGLALPDAVTPLGTVGARAAEPAFIVVALICALFAWAALGGVSRHPYGWLFRKLVRPRLAAPSHLEDPRPPTFSQGVGLVVTLVGVALHLAGVPLGLVIPAAAAFIAAFLNAAFDYCLGCQIYLLLARAGIVARRALPAE